MKSLIVRGVVELELDEPSGAFFEDLDEDDLAWQVQRKKKM